MWSRLIPVYTPRERVLGELRQLVGSTIGVLKGLFTVLHSLLYIFGRAKSPSPSSVLEVHLSHLGSKIYIGVTKQRMISV